jgi:hypothetical protein
MLGVIGWDAQSAVRAAVAAARWALVRWELADRFPWEALEVAEAWIQSPGQEAESAAAKATIRIREQRKGLDDEVLRWASHSAEEAVRAAFCTAPEWRGGAAYGAVRAACRTEEEALKAGADPREQGLEQALAEALIPWALGADAG